MTKKDPKQAMLRSLIPGLGQIYNKSQRIHLSWGYGCIFSLFRSYCPTRN